MAIRTILEAPEPRLRIISKPVAEVTDDTRALIADMFETMYDAPGIGLAAIQVGVAERILVIDLQEPVEHDHEHGEACNHDHDVINDPRVFINPEILETASDMRAYEEGCLSVPDQYAEVDRPDWCVARWMDEKGERHEERIDGLLATCLQHEMDHLEGILFIDHLSRMRRTMVLKKLEKARRLQAA